MARTLHSLVSSGVVSPRSYRKMLERHQAAQSDGGRGTPGAIDCDEINDPAHTSAGSRTRASGLPRNTARGNKAPGPDHLEDPRFQKKRYPGRKVTGKGNPSGPVSRVGVRKRPAPTGGLYGGGGRETQ